MVHICTSLSTPTSMSETLLLSRHRNCTAPPTMKEELAWSLARDGMTVTRREEAAILRKAAKLKKRETESVNGSFRREACFGHRDDASLACDRVVKSNKIEPLRRREHCEGSSGLSQTAQVEDQMRRIIGQSDLHLWAHRDDNHLSE